MESLKRDEPNLLRLGQLSLLNSAGPLLALFYTSSVPSSNLRARNGMNVNGNVCEDVRRVFLWPGQSWGKSCYGSCFQHPELSGLAL